MVYIGYDIRECCGVPMYKDTTTGEIFYDEDNIEVYSDKQEY